MPRPRMPSSTDRRTVAAPNWPARQLVALAAGLLVAITVAWPGDANAKKPGDSNAAVPRGFFGVSAVDPDASEFQRMRETSVGTYRVAVLWPAVQQSADGPLDWTIPDREIAGAVANGLQPLAVLYGSARFAAPETEAAPIGSEQSWERFVEAAVRRYGPGGGFWAEHPELTAKPVRVWQVWNEQNADFFWRPAPSPVVYAEFLRLTSTAIRRADPTADVSLGGMYGYPNGSRSIDLKPFLKRLYRVRSVRRYFDAVAVHPYGGSLRVFRNQVTDTRRIMNRNRDRKVPLLVTEMGWSTDGPPDWPIVTTPKGQAKRLGRSLKWLLERRRRWKIKQMVWFAWKDFHQDLCGWCGGSGLLNLDGSPKPAWSRFTRFTRAAR